MNVIPVKQGEQDAIAISSQNRLYTGHSSFPLGFWLCLSKIMNSPFRRASSFPHISHWPWAGRINKDVIRETAANTKVPNEFPTRQTAQTRVPSAGNLCKAITPTRLKFPRGGQDQRQGSVRWLPVHLRVRRYPRSNYSTRHHHLRPRER